MKSPSSGIRIAQDRIKMYGLIAVYDRSQCFPIRTNGTAKKTHGIPGCNIEAYFQNKQSSVSSNKLIRQYLEHYILGNNPSIRSKKSNTNGEGKKQESSRETSTALLTTPKPLCGSQQTVENSSRDGNTITPYLPSEKSVCMSRSNSQNQTWNN